MTFHRLPFPSIRYYAFKIVLPLLICTLFCFAAFFFVPSELEARAPSLPHPSTTPRSSPPPVTDHLPRIPPCDATWQARCAISTTMFLATAALLYVIGTEVPKTSYLTVCARGAPGAHELRHIWALE